MAQNSGRTLTDPNTIGDLVISGTQLGVGTVENLSTLTVRARNSFPLTGTLSKTNGSATVTGAGTHFLSELTVGDRIAMPQDEDPNTLAVIAIASDTSLTVEAAFQVTSSGAATCQPSSLRVDDYTGTPQLIVNDQGNVGINTMAPRATLEVGGQGAGELFQCPVNVRVDTQIMSDAWPIAMTTEFNGDTFGVALWATQISGGGGAVTFSPFDGGNMAQDNVIIDSNGLHLSGAGFSSTETTTYVDYTVSPIDHYIQAQPSPGGLTITLPNSGDWEGRVLFIIKTAGTGDVTVAPSTGDTINGAAANKTISTVFSGLHLISLSNTWVAMVMPAA